MNISYQTKKDLLPVECSSNRWWYDLSYEKEEMNQNDIVSMIRGDLTTNWTYHNNRHRLTCFRSSRWWYDSSYAKEQQLKCYC